LKVTKKINIGIDENNIEHETIHRRQSERRGGPRRKSKPLLASTEEIKTLRKLDEPTLISLRVGDRRQKDRRKSKVSFLTIEEIKSLRNS